MNKISSFSLLLIMIIFFRCTVSPGERYKSLEEHELASGVRYDSLFKGLYFGMKHQDFRDYCYYKNTVEHDFKMAGPVTSWLESKLPEEMSYPAAINFYPVFKDNKIAEINALVYYDNVKFKDGIFEKDSLLLDVLGLMKKWYGREFIKIKSPDAYRDDIYVSIRGNRRITVYPATTPQINVWMVDMLAMDKKEEDQ